jgi:hypothetical protein
MPDTALDVQQKTGLSCRSETKAAVTPQYAILRDRPLNGSLTEELYWNFSR